MFNASVYAKDVRPLTLNVDKEYLTHRYEFLWPEMPGHYRLNDSTMPERLTSIVPIVSQHLTHLVSFGVFFGRVGRLVCTTSYDSVTSGSITEKLSEP